MAKRGTLLNWLRRDKAIEDVVVFDHEHIGGIDGNNPPAPAGRMTTMHHHPARPAACQQG
jgi:hypothetical protein